MIIQQFMKILFLFVLDKNLNDCDTTDFDLMKMNLDITMEHLDQIDFSVADPAYVCFEKVEIVMDDEKRTTYSKGRIGTWFGIPYFHYEYYNWPNMHHPHMLPYMNYPSNLALLETNTYSPP